jgi:hypothetical protein
MSKIRKQELKNVQDIVYLIKNVEDFTRFWVINVWRWPKPAENI